MQKGETCLPLPSGASIQVCAVIVTYDPDLTKLERLVRRVVPQVQSVIVVDNGSSASTVSWLRSNAAVLHFKTILLEGNYGVAYAHNTGIRACRQAGADYVILFDHDSLPDPAMVARLLTTAQSKQAMGRKVAAVGPNYRDLRQNNPPPFIKRVNLRIQKQPCTHEEAVVEVDYLISSGCLIPMQTLDVVGGMREELFIDYVDIEWGLRAKHMGYASYGDCKALMWHDLGEHPIRFLGKQYPNHSALRHYYHFRNAIWMYRQPWIPIGWKLADAWRLLLKYGFYSIFARPRLKHWRMMTMGIKHGVLGYTGRLG